MTPEPPYQGDNLGRGDSEGAAKGGLITLIIIFVLLFGAVIVRLAIAALSAMME